MDGEGFKETVKLIAQTFLGFDHLGAHAAAGGASLLAFLKEPREGLDCGLDFVSPRPACAPYGDKKIYTPYVSA